MSFLRHCARLLLAACLASSLTACPVKTLPSERCQDIYPQVALAAQKAALKIESMYHGCVPATYDAATFLADLQTAGFGQDDLKALQSASLDLWPEANCDAYVLVARCNLSKDVMFWDRSSSTSRIDGPGPDGQVPADPVPAREPATCTCANR